MRKSEKKIFEQFTFYTYGIHDHLFKNVLVMTLDPIPLNSLILKVALSSAKENKLFHMPNYYI